ncbi:bifunctional 2',3'-cyclic-nucleotide 2'-phosphodiesterase/3'-nucleotidase [Lutimaribacter sp. EGI FJ00013]|uniref:Bifunctional 2',3'-cyclic-nucleotide 2'-phosphodiesterase/3'-nucleotidase n=1 Tax=Lutimaribacter degradans TaxID=2945989 RepID=A0ACC5ZUE0_9RHOB|nr:bifunctional 2',3'-cyclic-nucleotide 2'-phosphodiesterase/3'-nucleotidase [Lutimaribacter sp. EGI FJ00013]
MATSDLHGHLMAYDYAADRTQPGVGLVRTASLIGQARGEVSNSLLVDNGDFLFGTMMADAWANAAVSQRENPVIAAMNALCFDAVGLGNHEFNFGLETLDVALAQAQFPVLCANVLPLGRDVPFRAKPSFLLRRQLVDDDGGRHSLSLGLVSVMPPQVMQWDASYLAGRVEARGIVDTARLEVKALRAAGADIVVVMNHSGLGDGSADPSAENAGLALARLPGVDVVLCGHKHRCLPGAFYEGRADVDAQAGALAGAPAAMPGCWGSHLAVIDLTLANEGAGWRISRHRAELRAIALRDKGVPKARVRDDPAIARIAAPAHAATLRQIRRRVGRIDTPISTHFSQVAPCGVTALVAAAQAWRAAQLLPDNTGQPLLSAAAPFRCGGAGGPEDYTVLQAGPVLAKDIGAIYPFPNRLQVLRVPSRQVLEWLEHSAAQFRQLCTGEPDQPLVDDAFPSYNFDIIHGLHYEIDPTQPPRFDAQGGLCNATGRRVRNVRWNGAPLAEDDTFLVATNSYRAQGGGNVAALRSAESVLDTDETLTDVLEAYLKAGHGVPAGDQPVWRFAQRAGVAALFRSGSSAGESPAPCARIERVGHDSGGYSWFRLEL